MKPMTNEIREKIKRYIKNGIDISEVIRDVSIRGEDLSYAIIKDFTRVKDDMSGVRLTKAKIGVKGKVLVICNNKMINSFWDDAQFYGHILFRKNDCKNSNFSGAIMYDVEYQNTDFRHCKFCETAVRLGTTYSLGSKFSADLFSDLGRMLNLTITEKE